MEPGVGAINVAEDAMMVDPHNENGEKTGDQADVAGPLLEKAFGEGGWGYARSAEIGDF